jgi:hypothetical protein
VLLSCCQMLRLWQRCTQQQTHGSSSNLLSISVSESLGPRVACSQEHLLLHFACILL